MTMLQDSETKPKIIYSFDEHVQPNGWIIVNDGVMGGLSKGEMDMNEEGNGVFRGRVSLENNGGFSLAPCLWILLEFKAMTKSFLM